MSTLASIRPIGNLLREWRQHRRLSQLDLALEAEVSARHISFLETGRSLPSRDMVLRLAEQLDVPLRERNDLLVAAGYAPLYPERSLNDPALQQAQEAVRLVLAGHEPYPALAVDRYWNLVAANQAVAPFFADVAPALTQPPINVLRATFHPEGLAPRIANLSQWRTHMLQRVQRQAQRTADARLVELLAELRGYPALVDPDDAPEPGPEVPGMVIPLRLRTDQGMLSFLYTTTLFGTPLDVTLAEIGIEAFFPADAATTAVFIPGQRDRSLQ
ncbi:MAG: helix-turn-helix transcriptional regulator [Chloroflexia bacterium]|nr:helix-turn-helix transcriptional regulator [Chloroflexia bacterium]